VLAAVIGGLLFHRESRTWPVAKRERKDLIAVVAAGGLIGAAIPSYFAGGLITQMSLHGLFFGPNTVIGGIVGGFFAAATFKRIKSLEYETSDSFVLGTIAGMTLGRIGCHFGHCCIGRASGSSFALNFGDNIPRLPTQLIEAAVMGSLLLVFSVLQAKGKFANKRLFLFMMAYGIVRFVIEFYRAPVATNLLGIGSYQWFAIALFSLGLFQTIKRHDNPRL
jgi:phosphatidylglycerol:prolipoprotein diacylglycerol transferase